MAQKQVRTFLILEKIAGQEGIAVTDQEAEDRLKEMSERMHQKFDVVKQYYEKNGLLPEVKAGIIRDKALSFLLRKRISIMSEEIFEKVQKSLITPIMKRLHRQETNWK